MPVVRRLARTNFYTVIMAKCSILFVLLAFAAADALLRDSEPRFERTKKELSAGAGKQRCEGRSDRLGNSEEALELIRDVTLLVSKYVKRLCPSEGGSECPDNECGSGNLVQASNPEDFDVSRCELDEVQEAEVTGSYRDTAEFVIESPPSSRWPADGFCQAASVTEVKAQTNYTLTVKLYANGNTGTGHIGVLYNGVDSDNYDFIYFRTHTTSACFQTGHLVNAAPDFSDTKASACPNGHPKRRTWIEIKVDVTAGNAAVYLDGSLVVNMSPKFPLGGFVGVVVANGYRDRVHFKDLAVVGC